MAKWKSTAMNLSSFVPTSCSSAKIPIAFKNPWIFTATVKPERRMRRNSKPDAASSSQVKLQDAYLGGLMDKATVKPVATKEESDDVDLSESETWSFHEEEMTERLVAYRTAKGKPGAPSESENSGNPKAERKDWTHNLHISPDTAPHMETVFSIVRKIYEREPADPMDDLDVNMATFFFLNTTLRAAVHLGQDYEVNLRFVKTHLWKSVEQLFNETGRLIRDQTEINGVTTIDFKEITWRSTSFCAAELSRSPMLKPCSSPTLCSVWEKWEMIRVQLGRRKLIGIQRKITSRN